MNHPAQRFVRILERGLQKTDAFDDVNRNRVYQEARAALARMPLHPSGHAENLEALELAITMVEDAYRSAIAEMNQPLAQAIEPASAPSGTPAPSRAPQKGEVKSKWLERVFPRFKGIATGWRSLRQMAGIALVAIALLASIFVLSASLLESSPPVLFSQKQEDTVIGIFGNGLNPQFQAFNNVRIEQAEPGSSGPMTISFDTSETGDLPLSFAFMPLDPAYVKLLAGKEIELGIVARDISNLGSEHDKPGSLTLRYHSSVTQLQETPQQLERGYKDFYFRQKIAERSETSNADMLIIIPSREWAGLKVEVSAISIRLLP